MWNQMYKNGSKLPFWLLILVTIIIGAILYFTK
jgi:paraquat-inducible protein B